VPLRILVVASETSAQCDARRRHAGSASHETYEQTLLDLDRTLAISSASCVEGPDTLTSGDVRGFDGVFFAGSPIQMHEDSAETRAAAEFMRKVFEAGTPAFGSCAGLQIAAVAAGGRAAPRANGMEAGFARDIVLTDEGRAHPMLAGRPAVFDAPAMHSSIVDRLPPGAVVLAMNRHTPVEAAEIRCGNGVFWGVQYHPEVSIREIAASLRRQGSELIEEGLALDEENVDAYARKLEVLHDDPARRDLAWQLGLDPETTQASRRTLELRNFLQFLSDRSVASR
jgi:GMP synthase (glutamine-hydrolysing)